MEAHQPKKMRPIRPSGTSGVRVDGDMLLSMRAGAENKGLVIIPTATVEDYAPAAQTMVQHNENKIGARDKSIGADVWDEAHGLWRLKLDNSDQLAFSAHQEFRELFRDGVLTLKAAKEQEGTTIKGGWLKPYTNTLSLDEADQEKSVLAIHHKSFPKVKKSMPHLNDVVTRVKTAVLKQLEDKERTNLRPVEYTFFCGTFQASCTNFHRDTDEHPEDKLVFTTLTLLSDGETSMCLAGKEETWLREPFDTVCFDPDLYHRSGHTLEHVVKLSIHWREVFKTGAAPVEHSDTDKGAPSEEKFSIKKETEEGTKDNTGVLVEEAAGPSEADPSTEGRA